MVRKERALSTQPPLQPFPCAAFTSWGCHGDRQNEHDCTLRQTCRKGRRDVPPPPSPHPPRCGFTLLCQRLLISASLINLAELKSTHVEACATTAARGAPEEDHTCFECLWNIKFDWGSDYLITNCNYRLCPVLLRFMKVANLPNMWSGMISVGFHNIPL